MAGKLNRATAPRARIAVVVASLRVDALVRADGGRGPLDLPGFPPPCGGDAGRTALLVDLADDGDEEAVAATRGRLDGYEADGWRVEAPGRWRQEPAPGRPRAEGAGRSDRYRTAKRT